LWLSFGLVKLRRLRLSSATEPAVAIDTDLQLTPGKVADIRYAPHLDQPVTFGVRRPVVLLPEVLRTQSPDIQRAVIGHELLHVQRRDWAWLIAEEIAVCLFWFHPAAWWLASRIQLAREEVVDELAILLTGRRKAYVEALLAFADTTSVLPTAAFARRRHLFRRIALVSKEEVMSSRRIVASCAAMALIVGMGSWYAVSAFPLHATAQSGAEQLGPGPLERSAHPVTPENPVPRRVQFAPPMFPDGQDTSRGLVTVNLTLDALGRIAEARVTGVAVRGNGFNVSLPGSNIGPQLEARVRDTSPESASRMREAATAFMEAALASVRQWRYDPPAEAPLTFSVNVPLGIAREEMFFKAANSDGGPQVLDVKPARPGGSPEVMVFKPAGAKPITVKSSGDGALRVGGDIKPPVKLRDVRPAYPPIAQAANVTGVVIMEVRIGTDGSVDEAHVIRSIPLLDQAALDAVKQWKFVPTMMNGQAVPVIMTVTVNFAM
jgi:protein TonB